MPVRGRRSSSTTRARIGCFPQRVLPPFGSCAWLRIDGGTSLFQAGYGDSIRAFPQRRSRPTPYRNIVCEARRRSSRATKTYHGSNAMLSWALLFLLFALVAAFFGFTGVAATSAGIAKILFVVFLVAFVVSLILGRRPSRVV